MNPSLKEVKILGIQARNFVWSLKDQIKMDDDFGCGCAVTSYVLKHLINKQHPTAKINFAIGEYEKNCHCWLIYRNKIIDPTATQFGLYPKVRIVHQNDEDYFKYQINWLNDQAFAELAHWDEQSPFSYQSQITRFLNKHKNKTTDYRNNQLSA